MLGKPTELHPKPLLVYNSNIKKCRSMVDATWRVEKGEVGREGYDIATWELFIVFFFLT